MRTEEEINSEVEALKEIKDKVPESNAFGDDNVAAIEAQIDVLENKLSEDDIYNKYEPVDSDEGSEDEEEDPDDEYRTQHNLDHARDAYQWMHEDGDVEQPSESWKPLIQKS